MSYYITSEYTIANILLKKKQKGIENPTTKTEEIIKLSKYIHEEMKGNCLLESSSDSIFSAVSMYNKYFQFMDIEDEIIGFVENISKQDEDFLLNVLCLPSEIDEVFDRFINEIGEEKMVDKNVVTCDVCNGTGKNPYESVTRSPNPNNVFVGGTCVADMLCPKCHGAKEVKKMSEKLDQIKKAYETAKEQDRAYHGPLLDLFNQVINLLEEQEKKINQCLRIAHRDDKLR